MSEGLNSSYGFKDADDARSAFSFTSSCAAMTTWWDVQGRQALRESIDYKWRVRYIYRVIQAVSPLMGEMRKFGTVGVVAPEEERYGTRASLSRRFELSKAPFNVEAR